jgi:hypothetical protein
MKLGCWLDAGESSHGTRMAGEKKGGVNPTVPRATCVPYSLPSNCMRSHPECHGVRSLTAPAKAQRIAPRFGRTSKRQRGYARNRAERPFSAAQSEEYSHLFGDKPRELAVRLKQPRPRGSSLMRLLESPRQRALRRGASTKEVRVCGVRCAVLRGRDEKEFLPDRTCANSVTQQGHPAFQPRL